MKSVFAVALIAAIAIATSEQEEVFEYVPLRTLQANGELSYREQAEQRNEERKRKREENKGKYSASARNARREQAALEELTPEDDAEFLTFAAKHNKVYLDTQEFVKRERIWKVQKDVVENLQALPQIEKNNGQNARFNMNKFSDYDDGEIRSMFGLDTRPAARVADVSQDNGDDRRNLQVSRYSTVDDWTNGDDDYAN